MKRVSIFLLSFVMALALARPAFALVDGADLNFNAYNKKVNAGPGAFYPLIKLLLRRKRQFAADLWRRLFR